MNIVFVLFASFTFLLHLSVQPAHPSKQHKYSQIPPYYITYNYDAPLHPVLLAACDGSLTTWSKQDIIANINTKHPQSGDTMAHLAYDDKTLQEILKVDPMALSKRNANKNTPLHQFAYRNNRGLVVLACNFLLQQGTLQIALDRQNHLSDTPAHIAIARKKWWILDILCQYGANLTDIRNKQGETAIELAHRLHGTDELSMLYYQNAIKHNTIKQGALPPPYHTTHQFSSRPSTNTSARQSSTLPPSTTLPNLEPSEQKQPPILSPSAILPTPTPCKQKSRPTSPATDSEHEPEIIFDLDLLRKIPADKFEDTVYFPGTPQRTNRSLKNSTAIPSTNLFDEK